MQAGDEIVKLASGPEQMTVAEVRRAPLSARPPAPAAAPRAADPGPQPRLAGVVSGPARGRARRRERRPGRGKPAARLARVPPTGRHRDRAGERLRHLDPPRGPRRRAASGGAPRPVPHAPHPARRRAAVGAPQLLPLGAARCRLLPNHRQARARGRRQRLSAHPADGRRPARRRSTAWHVHPRPDGCARAADQRRDRRHAGARDAPGAREGAFRAGDLVAARRTQQPRSLVRRRDPDPPRVAPEGARARVLQPARSERPRRPRLRQRGPAHRLAARRARATARRRGIPVRAGAVHGRDQRRSGGDRDSTPRASTPSRSGRRRA